MLIIPKITIKVMLVTFQQWAVRLEARRETPTLERWVRFPYGPQN